VGKGRYSSKFLDAIDAALQFMPAERPQTVAAWRVMFPERGEVPAFSDAPTGCAEQLPSVISPPGAPEREPKARLHIRTPLVVAVVLLITVAGAWWHIQREPVETVTTAETISSPVATKPAPAPVAIEAEPMPEDRKAAQLAEEERLAAEEQRLAKEQRRVEPELERRLVLPESSWISSNLEGEYAGIWYSEPGKDHGGIVLELRVEQGDLVGSLKVTGSPAGFMGDRLIGQVMGQEGSNWSVELRGKKSPLVVKAIVGGNALQGSYKLGNDFGKVILKK
jgi:hypothetical protein